MRPGNLHGLDNYWFSRRNFGETQKKATPRVKHPDIYKYSLRHVSPSLRQGVKEIGEQIYMFNLFTPEFCEKLIEEAEFQGGWETGIDDESGLSGFGIMKLDPKLLESARVENEKDTTLSLAAFPSLGSNTLTKTVIDTNKRHVAPMIKKLWRSFSVERFDAPYLLKYEPGKVEKMNLHYDLETVAMIVYLNTEYEGGGTYFPRWKLHVQPNKPGQAAMWPGGVSHEHIGMPITGGVRYILCCAFF